MKIKRGQAVILIYAAVIIVGVVYFGFLQHFGDEGLVFQPSGRDYSPNLLDILIIIALVVAFVLFLISLVSYKRFRDLRILVVSMAFFFFAVKETLFFIKNFYPREFLYIDNAERVLELLILVSFVMLMYGSSRRYEKRMSKASRARK